MVVLWDFMGFYGILWDFMGKCKKLPFFLHAEPVFLFFLIFLKWQSLGWVSFGKVQ